MYISSVSIFGIRGFRLRGSKPDVSLSLQRPDGSFAGWTIIAGRNGAGKTTFLRALTMAVLGAGAARALMESFQGWLHVHDSPGRGLAQVSLKPGPRDGDERWQGVNELIQAVNWTSSSSGTNGRVHHIVHEPTGHVLSNHDELDMAELANEDGPWSSSSRGWFFAAYGPFRRLSGHSSDAERLMGAPARIASVVGLFREDASLSDAVSWLRNEVYLRALEGQEWAAELQKNILRLLDDGLLPDGARVVKLDSNGLWIQQRGARVLLRDTSDGYKCVLALLIDIIRRMHECYGELPLHVNECGRLTVDLPGVVLIDEIDAHLHVSWQQRIGFWLKERFPRIQFIVATHSPFVCQAADPNGLIRLPSVGDERPAEHVSRQIYRTVVNGSVDDTVMSDLFGLDHSRSDQAETRWNELAALEARVLRGLASSEDRARYEELAALLPTGASTEVERALRRLNETLELPQSSGKETQVVEAEDG